MDDKSNKKYEPGDGIRSLKSSPMFRAINYELYVKPNNVVMAMGLIAISGCIGYIIYMRSKYKSMGYYTAVESDGSETFKKKTSKWDI
ncbi:small integral membrane protein 8 [Copidosoma floridanum]|uniref:small integral membrane protein 8 n=1 Tax=Copidosoma floridanum TaxID=29053 RepID=UPI0006C9B7A8|nr:small integral membrane protein 8 [Copidosoma floridanum]